MEMENKKRWNPIPRRSALVTLVLLVAVGVVFSLFSLALSAWEGISWGGNPELFLWNALPVLLLCAAYNGIRNRPQMFYEKWLGLTQASTVTSAQKKAEKPQDAH